jgi:hypothetical protein
MFSPVQRLQWCKRLALLAQLQSWLHLRLKQWAVYTSWSDWVGCIPFSCVDLVLLPIEASQESLQGPGPHGLVLSLHLQAR